MRLASNRELYDYMVRLSSLLRQLGQEELADAVATASRTAAGNMSTEFLGESRIALARVLRECGGGLAEEDRAEAIDIFNQVDDALNRRNR